MPANVRDLPSHVLSTSGGLRTNFRPQENPGATWLSCVNMDTFDEFNAVGKIPGSERVSDQHPGPVLSLHYFEYTGLDGIRRREALSASSGNLYLVNSNKSLTLLASGLAPEALASVTAGNEIHFTGESQRGLPTGGIQWDGTNARNWGLVAPGSTRSVRLALDAASDFTASTDVTATTDAVVKRDAIASVRVDKLGTTSADAYIEDDGLGLNLSTGGDFFYVWLFVPAGSLQKLATSGAAIEVRYGDAGLANSHSAYWGVGEIVQGWNLLSWDRTAPEATTGTGATLSSVDTVRLRIIFSSSSRTQAGFRWDSLYATDDGSPTAAVGAAGAITGAARYRVTYVDETGFESNAGPASNSITLSSQRGTLTAIPISSDPKVIARRIYRDRNADAIYLFVDQIDDNVTTTYSDNVAQASLGLEQPPLAGDADLDHSPPENFRDATLWNNRIWGISADNPGTLVPSNINGHDGYPIVDQVTYEDELIAVRPHALGLLVYANDRIYLQTGLGTIDDPVRAVEATSQSGTNGRRTAVRAKGLNVTVREFEAFLISDPFDPWQLNFPVLDSFKGLDPERLRDMHVTLDRSRLRICFFGKRSANFDFAKSYQYGTSGQFQVTGDGPGVDPQDLRQGTWRDIDLPASVNPQCSEMVERTAGREELWIGGADGYIYRLFASPESGANFAAGLGEEAVKSRIEWNAVRLGSAPQARGAPKYLHLSGVFPQNSTWRVRISLLAAPEGRVLKAIDFDVDLGPLRSDVIFRINQELLGGHAEYCQVRLSNQSLGATGLFRHVELFYQQRGDFRGQRAA